MIESNREWLEGSNQNLLRKYKEPKKIRGRKHEVDELFHLPMVHEPKKNRGDEYISPRYYHLQQEIHAEVKGNIPQGEKRFVILGGTDGGHLLNDAIKDSIRHLIVIESNLESFYHSLHITDWPAIFEDFNERGGTIYFHIGPVTLEIKQRISKHLNEIGPHNAANIFMGHDSTAEGKRAIVDVVGCLQDCINSLGFYDDERVGLAHSIHKIENKARFMHDRAIPWIDKPAVVCGNGPSLSRAIPQLKEHRDDIFVISCGTAIGALYREGVKPDFHIEQERPKVSSNWTKLTTTPEFREGITCLALNVVHPQTHELFPDIAYCLKSNDFGATVSSTYLPGCPLLMFVNPLAANAGVSILSNLGFKNIYLAGVDCAFAKDGSSHSKGHSKMVENENPVKVKGNFKKEVETNQLYNDSRLALEMIIKHNPKINFFNLSNGAFIRGARPMKKLQPQKHRPVSKTQIMAPFKPCEVDVKKEDLSKAYGVAMAELKGHIDSIPLQIKGKGEAFFYIDHIYSSLWKMKLRNPTFWYLVKGSITTQLVFLAGIAEANLEAFDNVSRNLKDFAGEIQSQIKGDFFKFDEWEDNGGLPEQVK